MVPLVDYLDETVVDVTFVWLRLRFLVSKVVTYVPEVAVECLHLLCFEFTFRMGIGGKFATFLLFS